MITVGSCFGGEVECLSLLDEGPEVLGKGLPIFAGGGLPSTLGEAAGLSACILKRNSSNINACRCSIMKKIVQGKTLKNYPKTKCSQSTNVMLY